MGFFRRYGLWLAALAAAAIGIGFGLDKPGAVFPKSFGWWVVAGSFAGGALLGLRAWWLAVAGTFGFWAVAFVEMSSDIASNPGAEDQRLAIVFFALLISVVLGLPVLLGAGCRAVARAGGDLSMAREDLHKQLYPHG